VFTIVSQQVERILPWLERQTRRAGAMLFARSDARALLNGWRITQRSGGLSRTYRDPRFDQFSRCYQCGGSGVSRHSALRSCFICRGTGRLTATDTGQDAIHERAS
jgi:hypothetical protein